MQRIKKMTKKNTNSVRFTMRLPEDMWLFYKKSAIDQRKSMMQLIVDQLSKYQRKFEGNSLQNDTQVSD